MADLIDNGWRFVYRDGKYVWVHPSGVSPTDEDCTDLTDAEFESFVRAHD